MKKMLLLIIFSGLIAGCQGRTFIKNQTHPGGYAIGEKIELRFAANKSEYPPDSVAVFVLEKKSDYRYAIWAKLVGCDDVCEYKVIWDGRKDDGSWPMGGRYLVYGSIDADTPVYSDTIQIGLGD
jgi:hypothetical protein